MRVLLILNLIAVVCLANFAHANNIKSKTDKVEVSKKKKKKAVILAKQTTDGTTLKISEETLFFTVRILKADGHVVDLKINKKTGEVKKD